VDLEVLDRMLTLLESRRNKALHSIADYRDGLAKQVREVSNRVIEADPPDSAGKSGGPKIGSTVATERQIAANRRNAGKSYRNGRSTLPLVLAR
jgi:hypothetical protein